MQLRRLGQTDLHVSPIIFGGTARRPANAKDRIINTAPLYDVAGIRLSERWDCNRLDRAGRRLVRAMSRVSER